MKKFLLPSFIFFISLSFCFTKNVSALDINISSSTFDYITSNSFYSLKSFAENKLNSDSSYNSFDIFYFTNSSSYYLYLYKYFSFADYTLNSGASRIDYKVRLNSEYSSKLREVYTISGDTITLSSTNYSTPISFSGIVNYSLTPSTYSILYHYQVGNGSYNYVSSTPITFYFLDTSYSISSNNAFPSLYDLYQMRPQDETPLLTSFFSLTIEKLQFITEYFSSNYLYLSIFALFILIFFIYLIKRRLY